MGQKRHRSTTDDYQYLQKSRVPMMHFQASLPRLPIPELEKTCDRYLAALQPILSPQEYSRTQAIVSEFRNGDGVQLQKQLKDWDKRNKHTNYISESWFDKYLRDRVPLPINYNPQVVFNNDPKPGYGNQLIRTTNMLISSLRFMKSLRASLLEPEVFHLNPKKSDTELFRSVTRLLPSSISWYGAFLFKVTSNILPPADLLACLKYILDDTKQSAAHPVGILTTEERNTWAKAREHLENIGNKEVLRLIDSGIFMLCLDDVEITDNLNFLLRHFLHSDGKNRWFDKSFSLLLTKDGYAAINFEHSWGDGVAVLRYFQDMLKDSLKNPRVHPDTKPSNCSPETKVQKLDFNIDEKAKDFIEQATKKFDSLCKSLDIDYVEYMEHGRKTCKKYKVSPDSVMQLSFQDNTGSKNLSEFEWGIVYELKNRMASVMKDDAKTDAAKKFYVAFHKLYGKFVSSYESCSTAAFKHGRTETMRPCTMATKEEKGGRQIQKNSLVKHIATKVGVQASHDKFKLIEKQVSRFCSELFRRLDKSNRIIDRFLKNNEEWLDREFVCDVNVVKTPFGKRGRPQTDFGESSTRSKRRKTETLRKSAESAESLSFAAKMKHRESGNAFCEAVNSSNRPSDSELAAMIRKCSEVHANLTKEAALGKCFAFDSN
ncbi:hypothetical protein C0J52_02486 [Blattella germanica]|nr:hypothetical protein C0J52_02486 [Blattella germanica]